MAKVEIFSRKERDFDDNDSAGEDMEVTKKTVRSDTLLDNTTDEIFKPQSGFTKYAKVFEDLVVKKSVTSLYKILSLIITNDSKCAITITKADENSYFIKQYDIQGRTVLPVFEEEIGGGPD
jgi:hypothetical protein